MSEDWITSEEAAGLTGYEREYIRRLVRTEKVRARKFATIWQIERSSLLRYLEDSRASDDRRRGPKITD